MSRRVLLRLMGVVAVALTAGVPSAGAADLWTETGSSLTSVNYWQGITFDAATRTFTFDGPAQGSGEPTHSLGAWPVAARGSRRRS